mgnify:CR=1 FL=1
MKNRAITGISAIILGLLTAGVPNFVLPVCHHCQEMMMKCIWAAKAEYGIGVLIVFLGILLAFAESEEIRTGISAALGFIGILTILVARVLIGFCDGSCDPECSCRPLTAPLMTVFGVLCAVIFFANVFYLIKKKNT